MNPDELAELDDQRKFLARSLDDLELELGAGDIDALDAVELRADYTRRLADVQRSIESGRSELRAASPHRSRRRVVATVAVVAVLALGAGVAVANAAGSRKPGETLSGNIRENSNNKLNRAAALQDEGKVLDAIKIYDAVIKADPQNAEALGERGFLLLRLSMGRTEPGLVKSGLEFVDRALAVDAQNPRWLFYQAVGLRLSGQDAAASKSFDAALANDPPAELRSTIEAIRKSIGG